MVHLCLRLEAKHVKVILQILGLQLVCLVHGDFLFEFLEARDGYLALVPCIWIACVVLLDHGDRALGVGEACAPTFVERQDVVELTNDSGVTDPCLVLVANCTAVVLVSLNLGR